MQYSQYQTLKEYYDSLHGEMPQNDLMAIEKICEVYQLKMPPSAFNADVKQGIAEKFRHLKADQLPAYYWLLEAIYVTSKKKEEKRTFNYLVGILKSWKSSGFGYSPTQEEAELCEFIEEKTGLDMGVEARRLLRTLTSSYGTIKMTRGINELKESDPSFALMLLLAEMLRRKFGDLNMIENDYDFSNQPFIQDSIQQYQLHGASLNYQTIFAIENMNSILLANQSMPIPSNNIQEIAVGRDNLIDKTGQEDTKKVHLSVQKRKGTTKKKSKSKQKYSQVSKSDMLEQSLLVEKYIKEENRPMRSNELFKKLLAEHSIEYNQKTHTGKMYTYMKHNPNIIKLGIGLYGLRGIIEEIPTE